MAAPADKAGPAESAPTSGTYPERKKPASLHGRIMALDPMTDRVLRWLPEFVRDIVQDRRRQLLYVERRMQRLLINEYRAQVRELAPILHTRGRMVGEVLLEVFTGGSEQQMTYGDIAASSLRETLADRLPVRELVDTLDPLLTPFIDPFVEGIKAPIYDKATEIKATVVHSFAATGAACLVAGFLLGRYLPRGGGDGGRASGSSGGRR